MVKFGLGYLTQYSTVPRYSTVPYRTRLCTGPPPSSVKYLQIYRQVIVQAYAWAYELVPVIELIVHLVGRRCTTLKYFKVLNLVDNSLEFSTRKYF